MINFYAKHLKAFQELTNHRKTNKLPKHTTRFHLISKPKKRTQILEFLNKKEELINNLEADLEKHIYNDSSMLKVFFLLIFLKSEKIIDILNLNILLNLVDAYQMSFYKLIEYWKLFLVLKFFKTRIMQNSINENIEILTVRHIFNRKNLFSEDIFTEIIREYEGNIKDINFALNFLKYYNFEGKQNLLNYLNNRLKENILEDNNQNISEESVSVNSESNLVNSSESESYEGNYEKFSKKLKTIGKRYNVFDSSDSSNSFNSSDEFSDTNCGETLGIKHDSEVNIDSEVKQVKQKKQEKEVIIFKGIKFEKLKFLGSGATAQVFLVSPLNFKDLQKININEKQPKNFALKIIYVTNSEMSKNLINEIKLMQSFTNDLNCHVIKLFDYEIKNDSFQILMEAGEMDLWTFLSSKKYLHTKFFKEGGSINLDDAVTVDKYDFLKEDVSVFNKGLSVFNKGLSESNKDVSESREISKEEIKEVEEVTKEVTKEITKEVKKISKEVKEVKYRKEECEAFNCKFHWPFTPNCSFINSYAYLSIKELKNLLEMLLSIFEQLATHCIIHRDIKHKNFVFINKKLKLIDFGLSRKVTEEKSQHNTQEAGTYSFMSPESILNKEISRKSDIWALGNLIHEIIFGELKFKGNGKNSVFGFLNSQKSFVEKSSVEVGFCKNECLCKCGLDIFEEIFFNSKSIDKENLLMINNRTGEKIFCKNLVKIPTCDLCEFHRQFEPLRCYVPFIFLIKKCLIIEPRKRFSIFELKEFYEIIKEKIKLIEC